MDMGDVGLLDLKSTATINGDIIRSAIAAGHIWPAFQPLVHLDSGRLIGFEVLARWSDPVFGDIPPDRFIKDAEANGVIDVITQHILTTACHHAVQIPGSFILAFNLSPLEFRNPNLFDDVCNWISSAGFPMDRVHVEITENALLQDEKQTLSLIERFKSSGMGVSLDDFGTGYSSLSRLHGFPFDTIKIDRSFVACMEADSASRKIVASLVGLGQSLEMMIVAEGVETERQADMLRSLGCDIAQGWLFGRPQKWDAVATMAAAAQPQGRVFGKMTPFECIFQ